MPDYIAVISSRAVRDTQVYTGDSDDPDPMSDAWEDLPDAEAYLGLCRKMPRDDAMAWAKDYSGVAEENIRLIEL